MNRRRFLAAAAVSALAAQAQRRKYRACVIGHTGRGNYGHGLDTVWKLFDFVDVVAVADPVEEGRLRAQQICGAPKGYADYREMLRVEKPDIVSVGPRHLDQRLEMITACAEAGCHIYQEKAFAPSLIEADQMVAAVQKAGVKLQIAHQMRCSPFMLKVKEMVDAGEIGVVQEVRGRGKEDARAGGEDLNVLGSHIMDVMRILLGDPHWAFSHVQEGGEELAKKHVRAATEPLGPIAGRQMAAMFAFDGGVHGYFSSKENDRTHSLRFGTYIYGSKGVIFLPNAIYPDGQPSILRSESWMPEGVKRWEKIVVKPELPFEAEGRDIANGLMAWDLFEAIEQDRKPTCSEVDGRWTVEMVSAVYQSQIEGGPVRFPLKERRHPLETL